jgi:hypothetical protein
VTMAVNKHGATEAPRVLDDQILKTYRDNVPNSSAHSGHKACVSSICDLKRET